MRLLTMKIRKKKAEVPRNEQFDAKELRNGQVRLANRPNIADKAEIAQNPSGGIANNVKTIIDWGAVAEMAKMMMTAREIERVLGVSDETLRGACRRDLDMNLGTYLKRESEGGKLLLRKKQFEVAVEKGDRTLLIWLGKNYLGQSDQVQAHIEADLNLKVEFVGDDDKDLHYIDGELED